MTYEWRLRTITFNNETVLPVDEVDVVVLVGPNGGGKSTILGELVGELQSPPGEYRGRLVTAADVLESDAEPESVRQWLEAQYGSNVDRNGRRYFQTIGDRLDEANIQSTWTRGDRAKGVFLVAHLTTRERLMLVDPGNRINPFEAIPERLIHALQTDESRLARLAEVVDEAFGQPLTMSWLTDSLHLGAAPELRPGEDRVSGRYLAALADVPNVRYAGDGVNAFVGMAGMAVSCWGRLLLVDEPEAFLHPAQAHRLGSFLAREAALGGKQLLAATHSASFLRGVVGSGSRVAVVRVARRGAGNSVTILPPNEVVQLWRSPVLQAAATGEGVFQEGVVVCESDGDARLYARIAQAAAASVGVAAREGVAARLPYFVHGGGSARLATLAAAYLRVGVPTAVIGDIDVLRDENEFRRVREALGIPGERLVRLEAKVRQFLEDGGTVIDDEHALDALEGILNLARSGEVKLRDRRREIESIVRQTLEWSRAKGEGIHFLTPKQHRIAAWFLRRIKARGLFLVPVGELEGWWPDGPRNDKGRWSREVSALLDGDDAALSECRRFVGEVLDFLQSRRSIGGA